MKLKKKIANKNENKNKALLTIDHTYGAYKFFYHKRNVEYGGWIV